MKNFIKVSMVLLTISLLGGCKNSKVEYDYPEAPEDRKLNRHGSILGSEEPGIIISGGRKKEDPSMPVNPYLWRAALDSMSFMPLASSDAVGGAIVTEWYQDEKNGNERYKFNILILGQDLSPLSLKVQIFKQVFKNGQWQNTNISKAMISQYENIILSKARKLKIQNS